MFNELAIRDSEMKNSLKQWTSSKDTSHLGLKRVQKVAETIT